MNRCMIVLLVWFTMASAHSGNRLYPIYELTDEMLKKIDIHDGLIDEWYEVGEPSMTLLDFEGGHHFPIDPSNLDLRIWLAWHDETNRIFAAFIVTDDEYKNTFDWDSPDPEDGFGSNDSIALFLDADHSGGTGVRSDTPIEELRTILGQTQRFLAVSQTNNGPTISTGSYLDHTELPWYDAPPYADAGGSAYGENPVIWTVELYVTPRDAWGSGDMEDTPFSELSAEKIIGFAPIIRDFDPSIHEEFDVVVHWKPASTEDETAFRNIDRYEADVFLDGLLLPSRQTTVESITWGRIKTSLQTIVK